VERPKLTCVFLTLGYGSSNWMSMVLIILLLVPRLVVGSCKIKMAIFCEVVLLQSEL